MRTATRQHNPPNLRLAMAARLARPLVHTVLQLKKTPDALGIYVIRNRRAPHPNGVLQNLPQRRPQPFQLRPCQPPGCPAWPNARTEKALIRIDVAHPCQKPLIEQGCLDGETPAAE